MLRNERNEVAAAWILFLSWIVIAVVVVTEALLH